MTIEELAARVSLNKSSVSRILNGKGQGHSDRTRTRVLAAAAEMGYRPHPAARALATGTTRIVGLWVVTHEDYSPYFSYLHHCLLRAGLARGYRMIAEDVTGEEDGARPPSAHWPVDGVLSCDLDPDSALYRRLAADRGIPRVSLGQVLDAQADCVQLDVAAGAREAARHLISAGCRRIALVRSHPDSRDGGYAEVMAGAGMGTEYVAAANHSRAAGYEAMTRRLDAPDRPDGLFCVSDELALGCYLALTERGVRVPEDVQIVGFDGLENARLFPCPISSVAAPVEEMCALAWDLLIRRLRSPDAPLEQRVLVPRLEIRASSRVAL